MLYLVFFGACWQTFRRFYVGDDFPPHFYRMAAGQRLLVLANNDRKKTFKICSSQQANSFQNLVCTNFRFWKFYAILVCSE